MSFWSWLGMADRKDILALESEISSLRKENKTFQEQNCKLLKDIEEANKKNVDVYINKSLKDRKQFEDFIYDTKNYLEQLVVSAEDSRKDIANLTKQINTQISQCIRILNETNGIVSEMGDVIQQVLKSETNDIREQIDVIRKNAEGIESILLKVQEQTDKSYEYILKNNQFMKKSEEQMNKLVSLSKQLDKKTENIEEIQEKLSGLSEYITYLWSIMKAVWVDSVLSDIDSLK